MAVSAVAASVATAPQVWAQYPGAPGEDLERITPGADEPLADIRIEGNVTIPAEVIARHIKVQVGRPVRESQVREDVAALYRTSWFIDIEPRFRRTSDGLVLTLRVLERPTVGRIEYRGNDKIKTKNLAALTGLKRGSPFDPSKNREAARRLEQHYRDKGFPFAKVELTSGGELDERDVVFEINEGPKTRVTGIKFTGNDFFSDALLRTKVRTKTAILWMFGGKYDPSTIHDDVAALKQYYHDLGFFDVKIERDVHFNATRSRVTLEYTIEEGPRYRIRNIEVVGNQIFSDDELLADFKLTAGDDYNARHMVKDVEGMKDKYGQLGRLFASVEPAPRFLETPGVVDLVYRIDEDQVYKIRRINVLFNGDNPHTKSTVVLDRLTFMSGDLADPKQIQRSERRLAGSGLFERDPVNAPKINIRRVVEEPQPAPPGAIVRGQNFDGPLPVPQNFLYDNSPQGDPFSQALRDPPPALIDVDVLATEGRTGRLMFGVGVNSDAGVVGNIVLDESNFDLLRPPTSFQDFLDGTAFRGGGQRFRLELVPGAIVSRYLVSWTNPYIYLFGGQYSLGVSGFYYNRFLNDWDEERAGGRVTLGRQLTPFWSVSGALRFEQVTISNPDIPTPALLTAALGDSFLSTFRGAIAHDTRDSSFLPSEGHFVEASYEQAFGDFDYPRFGLEGRQYFTTYSRPDGSGRHILKIGGELGWTGDDTPIYERYYAGGFQSLRGFEFRGVSPRQFDVRLGGRYLVLGTVEYQIPLTANDNVAAVVFSDAGTVENDATFDDFRVSVGAGLRLIIPAMGPVPLAFDFAVPLSRADFDDTQVFSFYIGVNY